MQDNTKNRLTVDIFGQKYKIKGEASVDHLKRVADYVDQKMNEVAANNPALDETKIAVLTTVNMVDEYFQLQEEHAELLQLLDDQTKE